MQVDSCSAPSLVPETLIFVMESGQEMNDLSAFRSVVGQGENSSLLCPWTRLRGHDL